MVVTSHNDQFLKLIWDNFQSDIKTLQLTRLGMRNCTLSEWDIEEETKNTYLREIAQLKEYLADGTSGDLRDIARKIRPTLETHLKLRLPHQFTENEWLGDFIKKIREADSASPLASWQGSPVDELTDINEFSKRYHHDQNKSADTEHIDDGELCTFVTRTLKLVGSV